MSFQTSQIDRDSALIRRFGESVRFTPIGEGTITVTAVFDNPSAISQVGQRAVAAQNPSISVLKSEVGKVSKGDAFEIDGVDYRVKRPGTTRGEIIKAALEEM